MRGVGRQEGKKTKISFTQRTLAGCNTKQGTVNGGCTDQMYCNHKKWFILGVGWERTITLICSIILERQQNGRFIIFMDADLWSDQKPWRNWFLSPTVNFNEVRRAQLAKFTLLTSTLGALGSFKVRSDDRESGVRKAAGSYHTYSSLVKLQLWFLSYRWMTCLWAELQPWCLSLQCKTCPSAEHSDYYYFQYMERSSKGFG